MLFNIDTNSNHSFLLWYCHCFKGALEAIHYVKGTVFISQHVLQGSIIVSSLWLIRGNLKGAEESNCSPALKGAYLFHWTRGSNFFLQSPHSFIITAQKCSFLRIWSHLLKKDLMGNFILCAVSKRVKLTNSILLIRTCKDSQYLLWKFYSLSSEK